MPEKRLSNERLSELIALAHQDPNRGGDWMQDTDSALLELQSRRKAESELYWALKGLRGAVDGIGLSYPHLDECKTRAISALRSAESEGVGNAD